MDHEPQCPSPGARLDSRLKALKPALTHVADGETESQANIGNKVRMISVHSKPESITESWAIGSGSHGLSS